MAFPGVVLRISTPAGVLVQADSYQLHLHARIQAAGHGAEEWDEVLRTVEGLVIETRAVWLNEATNDD